MISFLDSNLSMGRTLQLELICSECRANNEVTVSYYYDEEIFGSQS